MEGLKLGVELQLDTGRGDAQYFHFKINSKSMKVTTKVEPRDPTPPV